MFKSKILRLEKKVLCTAFLATAFLNASAETWKPFNQTGYYAIQYIGEEKSVENFFVANPLAPPFAELDWAPVKLVKDYNYVYNAWNVTHEGGDDMSFRNTQGGTNTGDLIIFKSQMRTAPNYNVGAYRANQTFKIWQDVDIKDGIVCAIQANNPKTRYWVPSTTSPTVSYQDNISKEKATFFKLIPLYKFAEFEKLLTAANLILKDTDKTYPADKRTALENAIEAAQSLITQLHYETAKADQLYDELDKAYKEYDDAGKSAPIASLEKLTELERRTKTTVAVTGELTAEDFRILRDEMVRLKDLDLSAVTNTEIPTFALAGHWQLEKVALPAQCEKIGKGAFMSCPNIKDITLGENITEVGSMAFWRTGLEKISIPAQLLTIGANAFDECRNLEAIDVATGNANYSSVDGVLYDKAQTTLIKCPAGYTGTLNIPATVTAVEDFACINTLHLNGKLTLPEKLEKVGQYAFENCPDISGQLALPSTVKTIGKEAFWGCLQISSTLTLPDNVKVGKNTFAHLQALNKIVLPQSLDFLPEGLFNNCKRVTDVTTPRQEPAQLGNYVFWGWNMNNAYLHVPETAVEQYQKAEGWKLFFAEKVKMPTRFTTNGKYYIQYVGAGVNHNRFLKANSTYNQLAEFTTHTSAPLWDLDFFNGKGMSGAFNDGLVSDLRYSIDKDNYAHINMSGLSFTDTKEGYNSRVNRQFTFWFDEATGNVAIQSNGYYFTAAMSQALLQANAYKGLPRPADYVFRLIPQQTHIQVTHLGYATFYTNYALALPDGVKAYSGQLDSQHQLIALTPIKKVIPANTAVVIEAKEGTYHFNYTADEGQKVSHNDLLGTISEIKCSDEQSVYTLQQSEGSNIGLYLDEDGIVPAHSAYLNLAKIATPIAGFPFTKDDLTGIEQLNSNTEAQNIYNLNGQKLQQVEHSGIYIKNGKKVLILK